MTKEMSVGAIERMCSVDKKLRTLQRDMQQVINKYLPVGTTLRVYSRQIDSEFKGEVIEITGHSSVKLEILEVNGVPYECKLNNKLIINPFNRTEYELIKIGD